MTADEIREIVNTGRVGTMSLNYEGTMAIMLAEIAAQLAELNAHFTSLMTGPDQWGGPPRFRINNDYSGPES
jgi:uncharacterized protein YaiL (DUF2058 family)